MEIFGFEIKKKQLKKAGGDIVAPSVDDGSTLISTLGAAAAYYGMTVDLEGVIKNENDLIRRYREVSQYGDCDNAVEDIVNEAIVANSDESPVEVVLDDETLTSSNTTSTGLSSELATIASLTMSSTALSQSPYCDISR